MLDKNFFDRDTNITAKVVCDSISESGIRITSLEVEAPRIILAEINTHNAISKNCSSTRAITLSKAIEQIETNGFEPLYWGEKKSGMSADAELGLFEQTASLSQWYMAKLDMIDRVKELDRHKVHKQISGRLLEPFQMVKQVLTATDWDNFFNLRIHPTAQPEILMLAYKIYKAIEESKPTTLRHGEWHLPYVEISQDQYNIENTYYYTWFIDESESETNGYQYEQVLTLEEAIKTSASCCAQVSYRNTDSSLEKADKIFDMLIKSDVLHASCFEHLATPIQNEIEIENSDYMTVGFINKVSDYRTWEHGITHMNRQGQLCSGNLRGFISYRHQLPNNTCWEFDFNERMKMFK